MSLTLRDLQLVAAALGAYKAGIDGLWGPETKKAMDIITTGHEGVRGWERERLIIVCIQLALIKLGYNPGVPDGLLGHNTMEAYNAWQYKKTHGKQERLDRTVVRSTPRTGHPKYNFPHQSNVSRFYGKPGPVIESQLVKIPTYDMVLDWDLTYKLNKITIHKKCAESAQSAFNEILKHFGQEKINELGLNRFAGSYNHRRMRGSRAWSMHAYACAIDFFAAPNALRTRCPQALFCKPEYKAFFDIWESHGWTSLGRAIGRDWMHVQAASL